MSNGVYSQEEIDLFLDFPFIPVVTTVPTEAPRRNGTIVAYESGTTRKIYIYINTAWRYVTLT